MYPIVMQGLTKHYGRILALDNFSLAVEEGACVGLLGPNGAGKTTTLKILCNLIRPDYGKAYIYDQEITAGKIDVLRFVGAIIETPEFYPYLTPEEMLTYLGKLRGMDAYYIKERMWQVLETVGLLEWRKTKIGKFSRGMKQRLALAQALLHDPPILILDEPMLGLDPRGMYEIREVIRTLHQYGRTILMSSHLLHEVDQLCDSVALINNGRLIAYERTTNLSQLLSIRRIEVDVLTPLTQDQIAQIQALDFVRAVVPQGNRIYIDVEAGQGVEPWLLAYLINEVGLSITSFKPTVAGLEQLYLWYVREA